MSERQPTPVDEQTIIEASTLEESLERAERIAGVRTLFRRGMDRIAQPAGFNDYLHLQARLPDQPFFNVLLLLEQCPDATKVASGPHWDAMGRPPRPAERGIWQFVSDERETGVDGAGDPIRELIGVGVETVYDIAQTRGPIYQEEQRPPVSAVEVQDRLVQRLLEGSNSRRVRRHRSTEIAQPVTQSGQLGLGLSFESSVEIEPESAHEQLPSLLEAIRERLIRRGRIPANIVEPVAQAVAATLMIQHGVDIGDVWLPELINLISDWSPREPHLSELQQVVALGTY